MKRILDDLQVLNAKYSSHVSFKAEFQNSEDRRKLKRKLSRTHTPSVAAVLTQFDKSIFKPF